MHAMLPKFFHFNFNFFISCSDIFWNETPLLKSVVFTSYFYQRKNLKLGALSYVFSFSSLIITFDYFAQLMGLKSVIAYNIIPSKCQEAYEPWCSGSGCLKPEIKGNIHLKGPILGPTSPKIRPWRQTQAFKLEWSAGCSIRQILQPNSCWTPDICKICDKHRKFQLLHDNDLASVPLIARNVA